MCVCVCVCVCLVCVCILFILSVGIVNRRTAKEKTREDKLYEIPDGLQVRQMLRGERERESAVSSFIVLLVISRVLLAAVLAWPLSHTSTP